MNATMPFWNFMPASDHDNVALNFHPVFIPLNQHSWAIFDFKFGIADLLYRFALSFFIK
jgi:hypothetical protein